MTTSDVPLAMETRIPLSRGRAGVQGQVMSCPMPTKASERYHDHLNPEARPRHADQWWKADFFITRLKALVEPGKVAAIVALRRYERDIRLVAQQAGITVPTIWAWEAELVTIVEEQLWFQWKQSQRCVVPAKRAG